MFFNKTRFLKETPALVFGCCWLFFGHFQSFFVDFVNFWVIFDHFGCFFVQVWVIYGLFWVVLSYCFFVNFAQFFWSSLVRFGHFCSFFGRFHVSCWNHFMLPGTKHNMVSRPIQGSEPQVRRETRSPCPVSTSELRVPTPNCFGFSMKNHWNFGLLFEVNQLTLGSVRFQVNWTTGGGPQWSRPDDLPVF